MAALCGHPSQMPYQWGNAHFHVIPKAPIKTSPCNRWHGCIDTVHWWSDLIFLSCFFETHSAKSPLFRTQSDTRLKVTSHCRDFTPHNPSSSSVHSPQAHSAVSGPAEVKGSLLWLQLPLCPPVSSAGATCSVKGRWAHISQNSQDDAKLSR